MPPKALLTATSDDESKTAALINNNNDNKNKTNNNNNELLEAMQTMMSNMKIEIMQGVKTEEESSKVTAKVEPDITTSLSSSPYTSLSSSSSSLSTSSSLLSTSVPVLPILKHTASSLSSSSSTSISSSAIFKSHLITAITVKALPATVTQILFTDYKDYLITELKIQQLDIYLNMTSNDIINKIK